MSFSLQKGKTHTFKTLILLNKVKKIKGKIHSIKVGSRDFGILSFLLKQCSNFSFTLNSYSHAHITFLDEAAFKIFQDDIFFFVHLGRIERKNFYGVYDSLVQKGVSIGKSNNRCKRREWKDNERKFVRTKNSWRNEWNEMKWSGNLLVIMGKWKDYIGFQQARKEGREQVVGRGRAPPLHWS